MVPKGKQNVVYSIIDGFAGILITKLLPLGAVIENEAPKMDPASASSSKPAAHKPVQFVKSGEKPKPVLPTRRQQQVEQEDEEDDEDDVRQS